MRRAENVAQVATLLPDYMGFIFYTQSPRYVNEIQAELIRYIPQNIKTTGVFVNEDLSVVKLKIAQHQLKAVQLHGQENVAYCQALKNNGIEIIKSFGIGPDFDFSQLDAYVDVVDYFLFDTQTLAYGGSGKAFDWQLLGGYRHKVPYLLSGGIGLGHLDDIKNITDNRLFAIDVNSRFEIEPGLKNLEDLKTFFEKLRGYFGQPES